MKVDVYNQQNKKVGTAELPDRVFGARWSPVLVHDALVAYEANRRKPVAHTKTRGEVRGGGRKPWQQKHTGRARHGSTRSPLWEGGGVAFGPRRERTFGKKLSVGMRRAALRSVLSRKLKDGEVNVLETLAVPSAKTKEAAAFFKHFFEKVPSLLLIPARGNKSIVRAARNVPGVTVVYPGSLSSYDCALHRVIFLERDAIPEVVGQVK